MFGWEGGKAALAVSQTPMIAAGNTFTSDGAAKAQHHTMQPPHMRHRMHHSAAVDREGGVMYVYGGVTYAMRTGQRRPADVKAGQLHAYRFGNSAWEQLATEGGRTTWRGGLYCCCQRACGLSHRERCGGTITA